MYYEVKLLHLGAVTASISLFLLRGYWMLITPERLKQKIWRVLPHVIDTVLLASGVALIAILEGALLEQRWLQIKLTLIVAYIFAGSIALKRGRTRRQRITALVIACALLSAIVLLALKRLPLGIC